MTAIDHVCPTCRAMRGRPCVNLRNPHTAKTRPHKGRVFGISDGDTITDVARRIITNDLMIADLSDYAWQTSLMLILSGLDDFSRRSTGLILVPFAPHAGGRWINGTAPGITFECLLVHHIDVEALDDELRRMCAVLYPTTTQEEPDGTQP